MDRVEERRLIERAQRGDAEAFSGLYQASVQAIFRYIAHRVNDTQLAEDLTGDVFLRALRSIRDYEDVGRPFMAWLYRIAHARVVDTYRQFGRRPEASDVDGEPIPVDHNLDERMLRKQAAQALREAIAALTDEQQQVVILRFIEGHRLEVVGQIMGKNANAIKALQHRALRSLASRLERAGFDIESILAGLQ